MCLFKWLYKKRRIWIFWLPNQTFVQEDMWLRQDLQTTLFILCICTSCSTTWTVALEQLCGTKGQRKLTRQNISKCQWNFSNNTARTSCNWQYRWLTNKRETQGLSKVLGQMRVPWQIFVMSPAEIKKIKNHPENISSLGVLTMVVRSTLLHSLP